MVIEAHHRSNSISLNFRNASMEATRYQQQSWELPASVLWMPIRRSDLNAENR